MDSRLSTVDDTELRKPPKLNRKQKLFIEEYYQSGNVYQSAIKVGFAKSYARVMTVNARSLRWIEDARAYIGKLEPEVLRHKMEEEVLNAPAAKDRIRGLEILGKWSGLDTGQKTEVNITFSNNIPRPDSPDIPPIHVVNSTP